MYPPLAKVETQPFLTSGSTPTPVFPVKTRRRWRDSSHGTHPVPRRLVHDQSDDGRMDRAERAGNVSHPNPFVRFCPNLMQVEMTPEAAAKFKMFEVSRRLGSRAFSVSRSCLAWYRLRGSKIMRVCSAPTYVCGPILA